MTQSYDIIGLGSALVDVLGHTDEGTLKSLDLTKGSMQLIAESEAEIFYEQLNQKRECSGGSVANSIVHMAALGSNTGFMGQCHDDILGLIFHQDMEAAGVDCLLKRMKNGPKTGVCYIFITPDAERTMATFLGAATEIAPQQIDIEQLNKSRLVYLEGYSFDGLQTKQCIDKIFAAKQSGELKSEVCLSLADFQCVERHRQTITEALNAGLIDTCIGNESEFAVLFDVNRNADHDTFQKAYQTFKGEQNWRAVITLGKAGAIALKGDILNAQDADAVDNIVDKTGAGDAFAAGYLHGYLAGLDEQTSLHLGCVCAGEIIQHVGARPSSDDDLRALIDNRLSEYQIAV